MVINNRESGNPNPYTLMAMPMNDSSIKQRARAVEFVQAALRTLAAIYVISQYPGHFARVAAVASDSEIFSSRTMSDVRNFFWQISEKYADDAL